MPETTWLKLLDYAAVTAKSSLENGNWHCPPLIRFLVARPEPYAGTGAFP